MARRYLRGDQLSVSLQAEVLRQYVHRGTEENRRTFGGRCPRCAMVQFPYVTSQALPEGPTVYSEREWHAYHAPLISDAQWLREHAFQVTAIGRLDQRQRHAMPACVAENSV